MKIVSIFRLIISLAMLSTGFADTPATPVPWIITSYYRDCLFKMVPGKCRIEDGQHVVDREAFGVAYSITRDGEFNELWRTRGWYAFEGSIHNDGQHFVRIGPWASDQMNHTDLAIAFYDHGKLTKQYQVQELIKSPDSLVHSVSHYRWRPEKQTNPNGFYDKTFHLTMIDKTTYSFDITNGKILATGIDADARSSREIRAEEDRAARQKGQSLFDVCSFRKAFENSFEFSQIKAGIGWTHGVWFDEPEWRANLFPKKKYAQPCEVHAIFPITHSENIDVSITPEEIDAALLSALSHPFVLRRFEPGGATGLRFQITGDRLHWDTHELRNLIKETKSIGVEEDPLRQWAYIIIDANEPRFTTVYINSDTKELIYEDTSKSPPEPILLDGAGIRINANKDGSPTSWELSDQY